MLQLYVIIVSNWYVIIVSNWYVIIVSNWYVIIVSNWYVSMCMSCVCDCSYHIHGVIVYVIISNSYYKHPSIYGIVLT